MKKLLFTLSLSALTACATPKEQPRRVDCEVIETKKWVFGNDNPSNPNILSIGDSISLSYYPEIRKYTAKPVDVFHSACNGRYSANGALYINDWLNNSPSHLDAVIFNHGIWDTFRGVSIQEYKDNLRVIGLAILQKTPNAFFVTTTHHAIAPGPQYVDQFNTAALEVMNELSIQVIDLSPLDAELMANTYDGTHFNSHGVKVISQEIAKYLDQVLN